MNTDNNAKATHKGVTLRPVIKTIEGDVNAILNFEFNMSPAATHLSNASTIKVFIDTFKLYIDNIDTFLKRVETVVILL